MKPGDARRIIAALDRIDRKLAHVQAAANWESRRSVPSEMELHLLGAIKAEYLAVLCATRRAALAPEAAKEPGT